MDASETSDWLERDTAYANHGHGWCLEYLSVTSSLVTRGFCRPHDEHSNGIFDTKVVEADLTVVYLRQKRQYLHEATYSAISTDESTWRTLLETFNVLPSFIEILHSNNGGSLKHITYAPAKDSGKSDSNIESIPLAFHVGYKLAIGAMTRRQYTAESTSLLVGPLSWC